MLATPIVALQTPGLCKHCFKFYLYCLFLRQSFYVTKLASNSQSFCLSLPSDDITILSIIVFFKCLKKLVKGIGRWLRG